MKRSKQKWEPRCPWCHADIDDRSPFSTPLDGIEPYGSVGLKVCGPLCPSRPEGAVVYEYVPWYTQRRRSA